MNRSYSLKKNKEFQYVYRAGKTHTGRSAVMLCARSRHGSLRVGFSVSKKVGNAVARNRVKRRMRESFRAHLPRLKRGYSIVFVARAQAAREDFAALNRDVERLIEKAGLFVRERD